MDRRNFLHVTGSAVAAATAGTIPTRAAPTTDTAHLSLDTATHVDPELAVYTGDFDPGTVDRLLATHAEKYWAVDGPAPGHHVKFAPTAVDADEAEDDYDHEAMLTIYDSGKYILRVLELDSSARITGAFADHLRAVDVDPGEALAGTELTNLAATGELDPMPSSDKLDAALQENGIELAETGSTALCKANDCSIHIFTTGKTIITGASSVAVADDTFASLQTIAADIAAD